MISKIIALMIYIIIAAIVIHYSQGRISRNSYLKSLLLIYAGLLIYWIFSIIMLYVFKIFLFCVIGFIGSCVVSFILWKLQILRLHDLNYSGWYILMDYIPFVNLYFLCIRLLKKRTDLLNDFDESIDYLSLLKKTHLYPSINIIKIDGPNFYLDEIRFEYAKYKDQLQFQVSVMSLKEHKHIEEYCRKNLIQTENSPSYTENMTFLFWQIEIH